MSKINWSKLDNLGKKPDKMIAKELGIHLDVVKRNRKRLGISPYSEQINWDKVDFSLSNKTLSEIYNIGAKEIAKR